MKSAAKALLVALAPLALAPYAPAWAHSAPPAAVAPFGPEADYPVTVGDPYVIGGVSYTPSDTLNYDAVGYAHAGTEGAGISGAHHTLPLPCYVEVTALDTGRTVLVRLDRRGPMTGKQLVELSPAAWAQLGFAPGADAAVRVRRVNPQENERALLRTGNRAPDRMDTPPGLLTALRRKLGIATPSTPDEPPSATLSGAPTQKPVAPSLPAASKPVPRSAPKPAPPPPPTPVPTAPRVEPVKPASAGRSAGPSGGAGCGVFLARTGGKGRVASRRQSRTRRKAVAGTHCREHRGTGPGRTGEGETVGLCGGDDPAPRLIGAGHDCRPLSRPVWIAVCCR